MTREKRLVATTEPDLRPPVRASELGFITSPNLGGPVLASALPPRPPTPTAEWMLKEVPVQAIGRAFVEVDTAARTRILTWAFQIDIADPAESALLDTLHDAFAVEREARGFGPGARMLPDQIAAAWHSFVEARPEVGRAIEILRARPPWRQLPFVKRERMPVSPLARAEAITDLLGVQRTVADLTPFLAMADAIEELWEGLNPKVGRFISESALQRALDEVGAIRPELLARMNEERERVRRVLEIQKRKEAAASLAAAGLSPRMPSSVGIGPVIQIKEGDLEYPPEELIPLPAASPSNTTLRRVLTGEEARVADAASTEATKIEDAVVEPTAGPPSERAPKSELAADEAVVDETVRVETAPSTKRVGVWLWFAALMGVALVVVLAWRFGVTSDVLPSPTSSAPVVATSAPLTTDQSATTTVAPSAPVSASAPSTASVEPSAPPPVRSSSSSAIATSTTSSAPPSTVGTAVTSSIPGASVSGSTGANIF